MIRKIPACLALVLVFTLLVSPESKSESADSYSKHFLKQELLLNQLITNVHILQLDFLDRNAREALQEQQIQLDVNFQDWPRESQDKENTELQLTIQNLWPVIQEHLEWLASLPEQGRLPRTGALLRALRKLDHKIMLLREKQLSSQPEAGQKLRFLEQAVMMQRLTRDYLSLTLASQQAENIAIRKGELSHQANHFQQRLTAIHDDMSSHVHADIPVYQSLIAWRYIEKSFTTFPEQQTPALIVRHNNRIVRKLSSVQRMF